MNLQCIVLRDPLHHVRHSGLKNLLECQGVHHCEDPSKVLQNLLLLLHAYSLTVGHPDVCLLVIGNLHLVSTNMTCYTGLLKNLGYFYMCLHLHKHLNMFKYHCTIKKIYSMNQDF